MLGEEKIIIKRLTKPQTEDIEALVRWLCDTFDFGERNSEPEMLEAIIKSSMEGDGVTSMELHQRFDVPRNTVIFYLNRFMDTGLVSRRGRSYFLRAPSLQDTIEEIESNMLREFERMMKYAEKLDQLLERDIYGRQERELEEREGARIEGDRSAQPAEIRPTSSTKKPASKEQGREIPIE